MLRKYLGHATKLGFKSLRRDFRTEALHEGKSIDEGFAKTFYKHHPTITTTGIVLGILGGSGLVISKCELYNAKKDLKKIQTKKEKLTLQDMESQRYYAESLGPAAYQRLISTSNTPASLEQAKKIAEINLLQLQIEKAEAEVAKTKLGK